MRGGYPVSAEGQGQKPMAMASDENPHRASPSAYDAVLHYYEATMAYQMGQEHYQALQGRWHNTQRLLQQAMEGIAGTRQVPPPHGQAQPAAWEAQEQCRQRQRDFAQAMRHSSILL